MPEQHPRAGHGLGLEIVVVLVTLGGFFGYAVLNRARGKAESLDCKDRLRQIGLAHLMYTDDKIYFPHSTRIGSLDEDAAGDGPATTSQNPRALLWYGYLDDPSMWACPSDELSRARTTGPLASEEARRSWHWAGPASGGASLSPFVDGRHDPAIERSAQLSYGWTRKSYNRGTRSTSYIAADRAVETERSAGNHAGGWNVLFADAAVLFQPVGQRIEFPVDDLHPADLLSKTARNYDGFLAIRDQQAELGRAN